VSLPARLLGANPSIQVSSLLSGTLTTPSAKGAFIPPGTQAFESIQTVTVTSSSSTELTFTSIPAHFKHLRIIGLAKSTYTNSGTGQSGWAMYFNDTLSGQYTSQSIRGNNSVVSRNAATAQNRVEFLSMAWNTAGNYGTQVRTTQFIDIFDIQASKAKVVMYTNGFSVRNTGTNQEVVVATSLWNNQAAITKITLDASASFADGPFAQNTKFTLYGLRG
jgi:hypothetical protein